MTNTARYRNCVEVKDSRFVPPIRYKLGWSDFEKKYYTFYVVPNCCRAPLPKFHVLMLPFHALVAGPQKILTVTLKWAIFFYSFNIYKGRTWNKLLFFSLFESQKWRETPPKNYTSKTVLSVIEKLQKY